MRRLTAIVFTDIAGFTALSGQDESRAFKVLERQRELVFPLLEQHCGQCLKEIGDGLLLSFPSSLQAVKCAIEIQKVTVTEPDLRLRIGIHQGDVIEHKGDLLGDGVNTAARLEPLSPIRGVVMSQRVYEDISSYPEYNMICMGTPPLKGVQKKLTVYCLVNDGLPPPTQFWLAPEFEAGAKVGGYEILAKIGSGNHGQVWLSRSATGQNVALKIMKRQDMEDDQQFDREFKGICHYEPLSRACNGLVDILHVSRDDEAGYYFYVMELADDVRDGQEIVPETYRPKNLASELASRGRLPATECLHIAMEAARALGNLHSNNVVHRDIRPSSVIYCLGNIKLADISFITTIGGSFSASGTQGYAPIEGPGYPPADVYSLGKVIYELMTGMNRGHFPDLPTTTPGMSREELQLHGAIMQVLRVACHDDPTQRYPDGSFFHEALKALHVEPSAGAGNHSSLTTDETQAINSFIRFITYYNGHQIVRDLPKTEIQVGRTTNSHAVDLDLNPDTSVSRVHARIWFQDDIAWIEDLSSSYGTKINGHSISGPHALTSADIIGLGETTLTIQYNSDFYEK